jgi:hypothetical protein
MFIAEEFMTFRKSLLIVLLSLAIFAVPSFARTHHHGAHLTRVAHKHHRKHHKKHVHHAKLRVHGHHHHAHSA